MAAPSEFEHLRDLLLAPEVTSLHTLQRDLEALQRQVQDPEEIARLLEPVLAELLRRRDPLISSAILRAVTPYLDQAVREKSAQDRPALSRALAPSSTEAIAIHYADAPQAAAQDLAPLMSAAMKEQIRGERDAVIDALYPVIGSTISKYLSETLNTLIQRMNERIETHLSFRAIARKIRSRVTGVSEGELLLRDSLWCRVDAAFLIQKASGLVIAQAQNPDTPPLDSDLLSGMLTAIRGLFNESMSGNGRIRELDQIEYGDSRIVLEVAGSFYIAAVVSGIPTDSFRERLRETVRLIVQLPGNAISEFTGDTASVPSPVAQSVEALVRDTYGSEKPKRTSPPYGVIVIGIILLLALCVPLGISWYRDSVDRQKEGAALAALRATDSTAFRDVSVDVDRDRLRLSGAVANEYLRNNAAGIALTHVPDATLDNGITTEPAPAFPVLLGRRAELIASALNTLEGVFLEVEHTGPDLSVGGIVPDTATERNVTGAFSSLPGLRSYRSHVSPGSNELPSRLLFSLNSVQIRPTERAILAQIRAVMDQTPWAALIIVGHSDLTGNEPANELIARGRAVAVRDALIALGVPDRRIQVEGSPGPPPDLDGTTQDSLSRCVRFKLVPLTRTIAP
ncbi:MAG: OmpA family protein [Bacteroidetes bacterium]|nr:OmpA family protein [Bacteroidota bacterium]